MSRRVTLLSAASSSSAPSSLTDATLGAALPFHCDQAVVLVHNPAGTGTVTATLRLWGYNPEVGRWYDLGALNGGSAIPESSVADTIAYAEGVAGLRAFTRLYCEISGALGGTGTTITVEAVCTRAEPVTTA